GQGPRMVAPAGLGQPRNRPSGAHLHARPRHGERGRDERAGRLFPARPGGRTMSRAASEELIRHFFEAFNAADVHAMLACLSEDVVLVPTQQSRLIGLETLRWHLAERERHFAERAEDLAVMCDEAGLGAAAEYTLRGTY